MFRSATTVVVIPLGLAMTRYKTMSIDATILNTKMPIIGTHGIVLESPCQRMKQDQAFAVGTISQKKSPPIFRYPTIMFI